MKQSFKSLLKNYIKEHKQVTLDDLNFLLDSYNAAEHKRLKPATMERELRKLVQQTNKPEFFDTIGYKILVTRNFKGQVTGYLVVEKVKQLDAQLQEIGEKTFGKKVENGALFANDDGTITSGKPAEVFQTKLF